MSNLKLNQIIGQGAYSTVYSASKIDNIEIVVKLTLSQHQTLKNEINVLQMLQNYQGFPKVYGFKFQNGISWIAMEKLGFTLTSYINSFQTFSSSTIIEIGQQLIDRLQKLHSQGYLHLDIKPSNIIFSQDKTTLHLIDFGFATKIGSRNVDKKFKGNLFYSSRNSMKCGEYSIFDDIQSFFYLIYRLMCGGLPWSDIQGYTNLQIFNRIKTRKENVNWDNFPHSIWIRKAMKIVKQQNKKGIYKRVRKLVQQIRK